uniref:Immunoglobulin domain-containing protein n=1 Tax=Neolamprologus brichardi TaxID=32507 RepID=A0A3Q4HK87_NEOBR
MYNRVVFFFLLFLLPALSVLLYIMRIITTVSKVSVEAGKSISIPCLYESKYIDHVKYLCKGHIWSSCSYAVKTNKPDPSGKYSIYDDKKEQIFTVTIKNLTNQNTDYWCVVEINNGLDCGQYFQLSVTSGTPSLYLDHQKTTGYIGENITIRCHRSNSGEMKWCRLGRNCVTGSFGSIDGTTVTTHMRDPNVFTVTMTGLRSEDSGWYWCAEGDIQIPVYLNVTEKPINSEYCKLSKILHNNRTLRAFIRNSIHYQVRIYQGDALSPLLFCIGPNPLSEIITGYGYRLRSGAVVISPEESAEQAINTYALPLIRYPAGIISWPIEEMEVRWFDPRLPPGCMPNILGQDTNPMFAYWWWSEGPVAPVSGSLASVSAPQGSCGYNVACHRQCVNACVNGCKALWGP